jgi:hypothetical protein
LKRVYILQVQMFRNLFLEDDKEGPPLAAYPVTESLLLAPKNIVWQNLSSIAVLIVALRKGSPQQKFFNRGMVFMVSQKRWQRQDITGKTFVQKWGPWFKAVR